MVQSPRRLLFSAALLLVIILLGAGGSLHAGFVVHAANGDTNAAFDPLSPVGGPDTTNPPRLYAGDFSHPLIPPYTQQRAFTDAGTNGYCVTVKTSTGIKPAAGKDLGFSVDATDSITPPPVGVTNGSVDSAAASLPATELAGEGQVYCVVVKAPVGYKNLKVSWSYIGNATGTIELDIPIVTVTLTADNTKNHNAGGSANIGTVCTVGWDGSFLTGENAPRPSRMPNIVSAVDFDPPETALVTPRNPINLQQIDGEWCMDFTSTGASTAQITFHFRAIYRAGYEPSEPPDNPAAGISLPPDCLLFIPGGFELDHVGLNGGTLRYQNSPQLVIGALETACILGSVSTDDTLSPNDIQISPVSGQDQPSVSGLTVFVGGPGTPAALVDAGTLCFSYTSSSPGEQLVSLTFTHRGSPTHAEWSVTGCGGTKHGPLVVQWNRIDSTRIATSDDASSPAVTFTTITQPLQFNVADGTFLTSDIKLVERVLGSHKSNGKTVPGYLQGVDLTATLVGNCGYFVVPDNSKPTTITGRSVGGRFELTGFGDTDGNPDDVTVSIANSGGCNAGSVIRVNIDAFYPGKLTPALPTEYVDINFTFIPANKTPRVAWAGQVVSITYAFSSSDSCLHDIVHFTRPDNQNGTFLGGTGITLNGAGAAQGDFGAGCSLTVNYTSADPGEVDIEVFVAGNPYSKVGFPIFFLVLEDATVTAPATSVVSTVGYVDVAVRGYFVGTNPSGRPAETKPDGRRVPADRWILPDDWDNLKGSGDFRGNWSGAADLPETVVTFLMQNEQVTNSYKTGVKNGGLGWFMPDASDVTPPEVGRIPDAMGVIPRPRTLTGTTDLDGRGAALTFGDLNLSYEGCAKSAQNGNPTCNQKDVVGHTTYSAVVDYPSSVGKFPPIGTNTATTEWTWAGYKSVTVVNTDSPSMKYVVAHLRDRDGYCDAAAFNNTLGVSVRFEIDAGGGTILEAQGQPVSISSNRRFATTTTFDTQDDLGNAVNQDIARTVVEDDECQAWIKITNSLLQPTNVIVTFPSPPAPVPGNVRITGLSCSANDPRITVTNRGTNPVSLEGFALRSLPASTFAQEEHLGLFGLLAPGQSKVFSGSADAGWLNAGSGNVLGLVGDYARLVWNGFELNRALCSGTFTSPPIPDPLPLDGEGEAVIDIVVPFGQEKQVALAEGWTLLAGGATPTDLATAFAGHEQDVAGVYAWDAATGRWSRYLTQGPAYLNTMERLESGQVYWVQVKRSFTLTVMK